MPGEIELDPDRSNFVLVVGAKGSGKSKLAERYFLTYPHDRLVIDPTGDVRLPEAAKVATVHDPLPASWPADMDGQQVSLRYVPDPGSATHDVEVDDAVGLAFHHPHRRCLLWVDEIDVVSPHAQRTGPNMARSLKQGRHRGLSMLVCGIRPQAINPLFLSQADYVAVFRLPNPDDRKRIAAAVGVSPAEMDELVGMLDEHEFVWCDVRNQDVLVCPPIPGVS